MIKMLAPSPKATKIALLQVRNLIERLRAYSNTEDSSNAEIMFFDKPLGGLALTKEEASQYNECLKSLIALHGNNPDARPLSRNATEALLRTAILRALRPRMPSGETRTTFERRLARELRLLRSKITASPEEWIVTIRISGFASAGLPFKFGGIEFVRGTPDTAGELASSLQDFEPKRKTSAKRRQSEQHIREHERSSIVEHFSKETLASVTVRAVDDAAAKHLGTERIRRSVDVLNFFASLFHRRPSKPRAFVAPEGERADLPWVVRQLRGNSFYWHYPLSEHASIDDDPITMIDLRSPRANEIGLTRASSILEQGTPTDLQTRIINAAVWAGRASVEHRPETAFLLFTISLEALLTNSKSRSGVTDRLRLRIARLIGRRPEARKHVHELMGQLYNVRSDLVHAGDSSKLTGVDLEAIRTLAQRAITSVLTDGRFIGMQRVIEFESWLNEQLLT
ncbi:hypothetical protein [Sorangium sp. So ce1000]|uniref:hypothetical protein n=1 Tax=Sorangium sp. So ce1000 TaxID=3133325 RepID=UPI003F5F3AFF